MLSNDKLDLTNEELNELVGGVKIKATSEDIINSNASHMCTCSYYDTGVIINDNQVPTCSCGCIIAC